MGRNNWMAIPFVLLFVGLLFLPQSVLALGASSTDLWDMSNGTTINATSGPLNYSSYYRSYVENMFGGSGGVEPANALFKDYMSPGMQGGSVPAGYIHFVNWSLTSSVTLRSFNLLAYNEGMTRRAFDRFELFADIGGDGSWESIFAQDFSVYGGSPTYAPTSLNWLELAIDLDDSIVAQSFRAEFRQASWSDPRAIGPRIMELDGYDTFLDGSVGPAAVPEPSTFLLFGGGLLAFAWCGRRRK